MCRGAESHRNRTSLSFIIIRFCRTIPKHFADFSRSDNELLLICGVGIVAMDSELLTRGLLYLSLAVAGIPGNLAVIFAFLAALHHERRLFTADAIVLHLALANLLVVGVRCVLEVVATFQIGHVFNDAGCKGVIFVYRTARSLSIWLTFVLSAFQSLSVAPPGSFWATARDLFSQLLWLIFLIVWIINISVSSPSIVFAVGTKNTSMLLQNSINVQFCFINFPSAIVKDTNGAVQTVRDVVPMVLMTTASLIILIFLYKHSRQVRTIRGGVGGGSGGGGGGSSERRAAITVVTLVTLPAHLLLIPVCCHEPRRHHRVQ
ncbi:olfactory receptor class A-like protein 1 [Silurus meridionalis]|uniref:olfactory receptor class A-like protein 1 n=1 Tax=Silurus meridionalis TaxID=175797 RepID=UPI001EEA64A3|nr:olfactory receptor class A-like protein 1 [Silurus meridionalis]